MSQSIASLLDISQAESRTIIVLLVCFLVLFALGVRSAVHDFRLNKKVEILKAFGYRRYICRKASASERALYGWSNGFFRFMESEVKRLTYTELKAKLWHGGCTV